MPRDFESTVLDTVLTKQSTLNRSTSGQWHLYASHRQELERLLVPDKPGGRICILGAGNCNDLDLRWLTEVYSEVQLVDIDPEALERGAKFQNVTDSRRLRLRGSTDITGLSTHLSAWKKQLPTPEEIKTCLQLATSVPTEFVKSLNGPFDVVLSPCVLSQLLMPLHDSIGSTHPSFLPMLTAMRTWHFRLMVDLLSPGGHGVFAGDLLSSVALPDLARVPKEQLPGVLQKMQASGKCFYGLDPAEIIKLLTTNRVISPDVGKVEQSPPWLWHLGLSKTYAVYGITFWTRHRLQ